LNRDPPDLCLLSSWDYRHEPLHPAVRTFLSSLNGGIGEEAERKKRKNVFLKLA
jgi:hypothetical protein